MPRIIASLVVFAAFAVAPLAASAVPITVPTDLSPGDKYRLAFVTSTTRDATSTNIADYNAFVSGVASLEPALAALGTTWKAIGSTASMDARDNTGTNPTVSTGVPIYRLDDLRIADNNVDLWDGAILLAINLTEDGSGPMVATAWTGTTESGLVGGAPAFNALGGTNPLFGNTKFPFNPLPRSWIEEATGGNAFGRALYSLSDVLTVVPEPSSMILVCIGATAVVGWQLGRRRHRRRQ